MELSAALDLYCERTGAGLWAEPLNAASNAAFLIAALVMWRRTRGLPLATALAAILALIGIGSGLFHTFATAWASLADVVPIGVFILTYLFAANLQFWRWPLWAALLGALAFLPYAWAMTPLFRALPFFGISAFYWPVPLLIAGTALALRRRHPVTARGLGLGAGLLTLSLVFRSLDMPLCAAWPAGTHFLWHLLNAAMLAWMIEVYARHMLAERRAGR